MSDAVNKPAHYNQGQIECIDAMKIVLTPEEFRGYLKGNVFKYLWREKDKNGNEDLRKGKSYYDWLIELVDEYEQQKAADLQSLKDYPFGKLRQPAWTPKVGDWVRIKKPADTRSDAVVWFEMMDEHDGKILQVEKIEYGAIVHDNLGFMFDWIELAEQPVIKQSLNTEPPDGWRFLEVGEVIRKGDQGFEKGLLHAIEPMKIGMTLQAHWMPTIRRNRFEVGEKVVENIKQRIGIVKEKIGCVESPFEYRVEMLNTKGDRYFFPHHLAPYIEDAK